MAFRFFDRSAAVEASRRHLPHWDQSDAYYFLTWRTADSIPLDVWEQWQQQRAGWLQAHGIDSAHEDWQRDVE